MHFFRKNVHDKSFILWNILQHIRVMYNRDEQSFSLYIYFLQKSKSASLTMLYESVTVVCKFYDNSTLSDKKPCFVQWDFYTNYIRLQVLTVYWNQLSIHYNLGTFFYWHWKVCIIASHAFSKNLDHHLKLLISGCSSQYKSLPLVKGECIDT